MNPVIGGKLSGWGQGGHWIGVVIFSSSVRWRAAGT
jgi:hypothetical protein